MYLLWNAGGTCGQPQPVAFSHGHAKLHSSTPGLDNRKCNPVWLLKQDNLNTLSLTAHDTAKPLCCVSLVHVKTTSWLRTSGVEEEEMFLSVIWLFLLYVNWDKDQIPTRRQSRTWSIALLVVHLKMYTVLLHSVERNQIRWRVPPPGGPSLESSPLCQASLVNSVIFKHREVNNTHKSPLFYKATKHTEEGGLT